MNQPTLHLSFFVGIYIGQHRDSGMELEQLGSGDKISKEIRTLYVITFFP